jgi:hypothetical protein
MDALCKHIREQLEHKECCTVFRPEIARVWPKLTELIAERNAAIEAFARERGWTVEIVDPGVVVTFRNAVCDSNRPGSDPRVLAASGDGRNGGDGYRRDGAERR